MSFCAFAGLLLCGRSTLAQAAVSTDLPDYPPGATVYITGSGFYPGEQVQVQVIHVSGGTNDNGTDPAHQPWLIYADSSGGINTTWVVPIDGDELGATLRLTALGLTSAFAAEVIFTDAAHLNAVTTGAQTGTLTYGTAGSVTYSITAGANGGGTLTVTYSLSTIPTPSSSSFSPNPVTASSTWASTLRINSSNTTPAGTNTFTVTGTAGSDTANDTGTLIISRKALTVSGITVNSKTYDGTNTATLNTGGATLNGIVNGDSVTLNTVGATATFSDKNVGTGKTVTISGLALSGTGANNYSLTQPTATGSITARALTVTASASNKTYDGTTNATVTLSDNRVAGDLLTVSRTGAGFSDANVGTGKTVTAVGLSLSGTDAGNYSLPSGTATTTANITAKSLTISSGLTANGKVYDRTTAADLSTGTVVFSGVVSGDSVTLTTNGYTANFASANVGNGIAVTVTGLGLSGGSAGNYSLTQPSLSANIAAKTVTVSSGITANGKVYDRTTTTTVNSNSVVLSGVISPDAVALSTNGYSATFASANAGAGIAVTVAGMSLTGATAGNYSLTQPAGLTANITQKNVSISSGLAGNNKVYDSTTAAAISSNSVVLSGVIAGDTVSLVTNGYSASFPSRHVGTNLSLTVSGLSLGGANGANYSLAQPSSLTANISARPITVTAAADSKTYDRTTAAAAAPTITSGTLQGSDSGSFTEAYSTKAVGTSKTLIPSGTINDNNGGNDYAVTFANANTGTITARSLTVTATAANKIYDGLTTASVTLADDRLSGDVFSDSYTSAAFASKTVGTGKSVSVSGISISGADAPNYSANTTATASADITVRTVTPTVTVSNKVYDATTAATIRARGLSNAVAGDDVSLSGGTASFADANAGAAKSVSISALSLSGNDSGNYVLSSDSATATADIYKAASTLSLSTSVNPALPGSNVTFTATVAAQDSGIGDPNGSVQFRANGSTLGSPAILSSDAASVSTSALAHGSNVITAEYSGDTNFLGVTNTLSPDEVVNTPPVPTLATYTRSPGLTLKIRLANLFTNYITDGDGDTLHLLSLNSGTNSASLTTNSAFILYAPSASSPNSNSADYIEYVISDGFWGGVATGHIAIVVSDPNVGSPSANILSVSGSGDTMSVSFAGIPGYTYRVQRTTTLNGSSTSWTDLGSAAIDSTGITTFTDTNAPPDAAYYRTVWP